MKLFIMTEKALVYIKKNVEHHLDNYINGDNPENWLSKAIGQSAFVEVESIDIDDFQLECNDHDPSSTDVENIKMLYTKLCSINDSFASDERLWAGLSHTHFYNYVRHRWRIASAKKEELKKSIINHFFFGQNKQRSYMINTIARLWWLGRKTYQTDNTVNPFYILDYISHDINGYAFTLFGSNWSNNSKTLRLFFTAVLNFSEHTGEKVKRDLFNNAMKYTNMLGGVYYLDGCSDEFLLNRINDFLVENA